MVPVAKCAESSPGNWLQPPPPQEELKLEDTVTDWVENHTETRGVISNMTGITKALGQNLNFNENFVTIERGANLRRLLFSIVLLLPAAAFSPKTAKSPILLPWWYAECLPMFNAKQNSGI